MNGCNIIVISYVNSHISAFFVVVKTPHPFLKNNGKIIVIDFVNTTPPLSIATPNFAVAMQQIALAKLAC